MINHHDTEEAVQNAWISIFKGLQGYKHRQKFEGWIKVIVIREAWKVRSRNMKVDTVSGYQEVVNFAPEASILDQMSCQEILDKLEQLPTGPREVFKMYVIDGYKHVEISEIIGISASTSRVHLTNARKILKKMIAHTQLL